MLLTDFNLLVDLSSRSWWDNALSQLLVHVLSPIPGSIDRLNLFNISSCLPLFHFKNSKCQVINSSTFQFPEDNSLVLLSCIDALGQINSVDPPLMVLARLLDRRTFIHHLLLQAEYVFSGIVDPYVAQMPN